MQEPGEALQAPFKPAGPGRKRYTQKTPAELAFEHKCTVHVGSVPCTAHEDILKQTASQFGPVKSFSKVGNPGEYNTVYGFVTFEDEESAMRALHAGGMTIGEHKMSINPRNPRPQRREYQAGPGHPVIDRPHVIPTRGAASLPERPPPVSIPAGLPGRKQTGPRFEQRGGFSGPRVGGPRYSSVAIYGLPDKMSQNDLKSRGDMHGSVMNAHIFPNKDHEGRRYGHLSFTSSGSATKFHQAENGKLWDGCHIVVTYENFNSARDKSATSPHGGPGGIQSHPRQGQNSYKNGKPFKAGHGNNRLSGSGPQRFQNNNPYQLGSRHSSFGSGQPSFQHEPQFYEAGQYGYVQQYGQPYVPVMSPPQMNVQPQYNIPVQMGGSPPPPMGYAPQQMGIPTLPPSQYPPQMGDMYYQQSRHPYGYPTQSSYPGSYSGHTGETPNSGDSSASVETSNARKVSGETVVTVPTVAGETEGPAGPTVAESKRPLVITPEHYLQAGYSYGDRKPENVRPVQAAIPGYSSESYAAVVAQAIAANPSLHTELQSAPAIPQVDSTGAAIPETKNPEDPTNIYVKNIDDDVWGKVEDLEEYFVKYGEITSISFPTYPNGVIKGFAFVKFATPEAALKAKDDVNLKIIGRKRLFAYFAESGDNRHHRLAKYYDKQSETGVVRSPPDPLIPRSAGKDSTKSHDGLTTLSIGDAAADNVPSSPSPANTKADESNKNGATELANDGATVASLKHDGEQQKLGQDANKLDHKVENSQKSGPRSEKRLSRGAEELKELDPAIKSIGRPESAGPAVITPRDSPSPNSSGDEDTDEDKSVKLRELLQQLNTKDLSEFSEKVSKVDASTENGGAIREKITGVTEAQSSDDESTSNEPKSEKVALTTEPNADESADGGKITRSSSTGSGRSSGSSRVSREEFSEALAMHFGAPRPTTIRAVDVMKAVNTYVTSREGSQNNSGVATPEISNETTPEKSVEVNEPDKKEAESVTGASVLVQSVSQPDYVAKETAVAEQILETKKSDADDQAEQKKRDLDYSNIHAPTPARRVSLVGIHIEDATPDDRKVTSAQEPLSAVTEEHGIEDKDPIDVKPKVEELDDTKNAAHSIKPIEHKPDMSPKRNIPVIESRKASPRKVSPRKVSGSRRLGQEPHGNVNRPPYQSAQHKVSPPRNYPRGGEQYGSHGQQSFQGFQPRAEFIPQAHQQLGFNPGFIPLSHPPSMVCDGPCCQHAHFQQPPPEMQGAPMAMGPMGPVPYFDPSMFPPQPFYGMDPRAAPPMFNGPPHMFQPGNQQWTNGPQGHPNVAPPPPPQGLPGHPMMYAPHGTVSPPSDHGRGFPDYGQYPPQMYGGAHHPPPMFFDQGMQQHHQQNPPHPRSFQGGNGAPLHYRQEQQQHFGGGPSVSTF